MVDSSVLSSVAPPLGQRIALGVSYNGAAFCGWQSQPNGQSVQDALEKALTRLAAGHSIRTLCAGRTDTGVHALQQVVHFDAPCVRSLASWVRGTNAWLPPAVAVQWARAVSHDFHARASSLTRRYVYFVLQSAVRPSLEHQRVGWVFESLDGLAMQQAALQLQGEHDFSSFRSSECQAPSPIKHLYRIGVEKLGAYWRFDFEGNAFLHHMIRNIMGCLLVVGKKQRPPEWIHTVLVARNRQAAAPTFAPDGLYFWGPRYAEHWQLPDTTPSMDWLPSHAHAHSH